MVNPLDIDLELTDTPPTGHLLLLRDVVIALPAPPALRPAVVKDQHVEAQQFPGAIALEFGICVLLST